MGPCLSCRPHLLYLFPLLVRLLVRVRVRIAYYTRPSGSYYSFGNHRMVAACVLLLVPHTKENDGIYKWLLTPDAIAMGWVAAEDSMAAKPARIPKDRT